MPQITTEYDPQERIEAGTAYEGREVDPATAKVWALHLSVPDPTQMLSVLSALDHPALTGEYRGGDCWAVWGRPYVDGDRCHVVVYLRCDRAVLPEVTASLLRQAAASLVTGEDYVVTPAGNFDQHELNGAGG